MIPSSASQLRDLILAEAHARGVPLEVHSFRPQFGLPFLRFKIGGKVLWGCTVRLPGHLRVPYNPDA